MFSSKTIRKLLVFTLLCLFHMVTCVKSQGIWNSSMKVKANLPVAKDGTGNYKTVMEAVLAAPINSKQKFTIHIKEGLYEEIVHIENTKTNLVIVGDGKDFTIISGSINNKSGFGIDKSATLGWTQMGKDKQRYLSLYYGEYKNTGPGADTSRRVKWKGFKKLTDPNEARNFTVARLINADSWLNSTGIPYEEGL